MTTKTQIIPISQVKLSMPTTSGHHQLQPPVDTSRYNKTSTNTANSKKPRYYIMGQSRWVKLNASIDPKYARGMFPYSSFSSHINVSLSLQTTEKEKKGDIYLYYLVSIVVISYCTYLSCNAVCHAEVNAILNKNSADVKDCSMYVALFPCNECAKIIIQSGIREVIYMSDKNSHKLETIASKRMFDSSGVKYWQYVPKRKHIVIDFTEINWNEMTQCPPSPHKDAELHEEIKLDQMVLTQNHL
ncbi:uncharacterized protein LOC124621887 isoform X1 [Schistocerca americana]|uniref:uncharacterized protein LOC124621887 isoform X1 n=1 Tax=Schistocerca americana TaxID=7009 RepID=UPI001F4F3BD5|nr:uncharacterized protein LOC124621887 isoform X1 [Schistocerca americana]